VVGRMSAWRAGTRREKGCTLGISSVRLASPTLEPAPKYPWRAYSPLRTHDFVDESRSKDSSERVFACRSCGRRFMYDPSMHETWAIAADAKSSPLQSAVSSRWIAQRCLGKWVESDEKDRRRIKAPRRAQGTKATDRGTK